MELTNRADERDVPWVASSLLLGYICAKPLFCGQSIFVIMLKQRQGQRICSPLSNNYLFSHKVVNSTKTRMDKQDSNNKIANKSLRVHTPIDGAVLRKWIQYPNAFYQGDCVRSAASREQVYVRHGQGILFLSSGHMIICFWSYDQMDGHCLIFTPFGGVVICEMLNGKMNGWVVAVSLNKHILCQFYHLDKYVGQTVKYDHTSSFWVKTNNEKTQTIHGGPDKVPSFVDQKLRYILQDYLEGKLISSDWVSIKEFKITRENSYIGYVDQHFGSPEGMGVIIGTTDMFGGIFAQGLLDKYGRMVYSNGDTYQGQMIKGQCSGRGSYYSLHQNVTREHYIDPQTDNKTNTDKTVEGITKDTQFFRNPQFIQNPMAFDLNERITQMSGKLKLLLVSMIRHNQGSLRYSVENSPRHSLPQPESDLKQTCRRKFSMLTEPMSPRYKRKTTIGTELVRQTTKPAQIPEVQQRTKKEKVKQKEADTITFMKRATEQIDVRMESIPLFQDQSKKVTVPTRRHKIFQKKSTLT